MNEPTSQQENPREFFWGFRLTPYRYDNFVLSHEYMFILCPFLLMLLLSVILDGLHFRQQNFSFTYTKAVLTDSAWLNTALVTSLLLVAFFFSLWRNRIATTFRNLLDRKILRVHLGA